MITETELSLADLGPYSTHRSALRGVLRFARAKPLGAFGMILILAIIVVAFAGPLIAPHSYDEISLLERLRGPSWSHPFGTDEQGRDVFSRVIYGTRTSIILGFGGVFAATLIATVVGVTSGFWTGWYDVVAQRLVEICLAFPGLIFIIFLVSVFGAGTGVLVLALGVLFGASSARVIRSQTLLVASAPYVEAARSIGCSDWRLLAYHVLPNVAFVIIVSASVQVGAIILAESSLAFLGFGTPPPFPSWGRMLQDGQTQMRDHPHLVLFPGTAIALTVYAMNMAGDALRDWWDPRLRE
jgi:peptide/nickel transport system permease protein